MEKLNRYRGCLLAGAVGDALGYQVEFDTLDRILVDHGQRGVRRMSPTVSDDTQMTLFTAEGMLLGRKHRLPMPGCVYQSYLDWHVTQGGSRQGLFHRESRLLAEAGLYRRRAPGLTCLSALDSGRMGTMEAPINRSKGCGGVMRAAPCGMLKMPDLPDDGDAWALQGAMAAAITHSHVMGWVPAAMLADMVHMILTEDGMPLEEIVRESLKRMLRLFGPEIGAAEGCEEQPGESDGRFAALMAFRELMTRAMKLAASDKPEREAIHALGGGWVGDEALAIAVFCVLRHPDNMADCLSAAVTHDGDSDSTGAIAGNILGAWLGADAIPADWLDVLEMRDVIDDMAVRLCEAANE
ncbi:MAG: ADP-ribosylglycohydrolase family protein [Clostridia bacterium]|nr:ADP-ribosylglycohydrolase family protein [Clostridia bacterium]